MESILYPAPPVEPTTPPRPYLSDLYTGLKSGIGGLASGVGYLADSEGISQWGEDVQEAAARELSPASTAAQAKGAWGGGGARALGLGVAESLPMAGASIAALTGAALAGPGVAGGAVLRAVPRLGPWAARMAAAEGVAPELVVGRLVVGSLAGSGVEGLISGGMNAAEAKRAILALAQSNPVEFRDSELGSKYLAQYGGDYNKAALAAADDVAREIAWKTGLLTGAISLPGGMVESALVRGAVRGALPGMIRSAGLGGGQEAAEEFLQSGSEALLSNIARQRAGDPTLATEGALRSAIEGGTIGAALGGGLGGVAGFAGGRVRKAEEEQARAREDMAALLKEEEGAIKARKAAALRTRLESQRDVLLPPPSSAMVVPELSMVEGRISNDDLLEQDPLVVRPSGLSSFVVKGRASGTEYAIIDSKRRADALVEQFNARRIAEKRSAIEGGIGRGPYRISTEGDIGPGNVPPDFGATEARFRAGTQPRTSIHSPQISPPVLQVPGNAEERLAGQVPGVGYGLGSFGTDSGGSISIQPVAERIQPGNAPAGLPGTIPSTGSAGSIAGRIAREGGPLAPLSTTGTVSGQLPIPSAAKVFLGEAEFMEPAQGRFQKPWRVKARKVGFRIPPRPERGFKIFDRDIDGRLIDSHKQIYPTQEGAEGALKNLASSGAARSPIIVPIGMPAPPQKGAQRLHGLPQAAPQAPSPLQAPPLFPKEKINEFQRELRRRLGDQYGLKQAKVKLEESLGGPAGSIEILGNKALIRLALDTVDPKMSDADVMKALARELDHEAIHALTSFGLFSGPELRSLHRFTRERKYVDDGGKTRAFTWMQWAETKYRDRYLDQPKEIRDEIIREEATAEAFKNWASTPIAAPGMIGSLFRRIVEFIKRFAGAARASGVDEIFAAVRKGEVGSRPPLPEPRIARPRVMYSLGAPLGQRIPPDPVGMAQRRLDISYAAAYNAIHGFSNKVYRATGLPHLTGVEKIPLKYFDATFRALQSRSIDLARVVDRYNQAGLTIEDSANPYILWTLLRSSAGTASENFLESEAKPAAQAITDLGFTQEDASRLAAVNKAATDYLANFPEDIKGKGMFALYLVARHASERNALVRERGVNLTDPNESGSGLSDTDAGEILRWFNADPRISRINNVADLWYGLIRLTQKVRHEGGLSPDWVNSEKALSFKYYVPLRGHWDPDDPSTHEPGFGRGLSTFGIEDRHIGGRRTMPSLVLESIVQQHIAAVYRARHNQVVNALASMVKEGPAEGTIEILDAPPYKQMLVDGKYRLVQDPFYRQRDDIVVGKYLDFESPDGTRQIPGGVVRETILKVNDPRLARFLKGNDISGPGDGHAIIKFLGKFNSILGKTITAWNPEYGLSNLTRDALTAIANAAQFEGVSNAELIRDIPLAIKDIHRYLRTGDASGRFAQNYIRLNELGGTTRNLGLDSFADITRELDSTLRGGPQGIKKSAKALQKWVEDFNTTIENASRTAVFMAMRKAGYSEEAAAYGGKVVTVNFDEGGTLRTLANSLYIFYNASIQGSFGILMAASRSERVRKYVIGIAAAGVLADAMNALISPDSDDDGLSDYDELPTYVKEHNIILMNPIGPGVIKIPMPYGYHAVYNFGRNISGALRGQTPVMDAATNSAANFLEGFNPFGGTSTFLNFVSPTILDPIVDLAQNRNWAGASIYPEGPNFGPEQPRSQQYWNNTSALYRWPVDAVHEIFGGSDKIPAKWSDLTEWSPNQLQYIVEYLTGGIGQLASRTLALPENILSADPEREIEIQDMPFVRKIIGAVSDRSEYQAFSEVRDRYLQVDQEMRAAREAGETDRLLSTRDSYPRESSTMQRFKTLNNRRNKILKMAKDLRDNPRIPDLTKRARLTLYKSQSEEIISQILRMSREEAR